MKKKIRTPSISNDCSPLGLPLAALWPLHTIMICNVVIFSNFFCSRHSEEHFVFLTQTSTLQLIFSIEWHCITVLFTPLITLVIITMILKSYTSYTARALHMLQKWRFIVNNYVISKGNLITPKSPHKSKCIPCRQSCLPIELGKMILVNLVVILRCGNPTLIIFTPLMYW